MSLGSGKPMSWWLSHAASLRQLIIRDTAERFSSVMPGILEPAMRTGVSWALNSLLVEPGARQIRSELALSANQISQRWAARYSEKLGEGLGQASADGMLVSLSTLQRQNMAESLAWRLAYGAAGLPPGQTVSVLNVAAARLANNIRRFRPIGAKELAQDIGKLYLSRRAASINATESVTARNFGALLTIMAAQQKGYLPAGTRKVWVTAVDERVCPVCRPMDGVAVAVEEPFTVRGHKGVLSHDMRLWTPPAHPNCRCSIVPESAIEHGILTRTARFSRDSGGRARLLSRLGDLISDAQPGWMDESEDVGKSFVTALHPRGAAGRFVIAGTGLALSGEAANLARSRAQTRRGYAMTSGLAPRRRFRTIRGITDAPAERRITAATHPSGTYLVSMASLARYRAPHSVLPSSDQKELRRALTHEGFTRPVHLAVYSDGALLWDGNHRLDIAEDLGIEAVPVSVSHVEGRMPRSYAVSALVNQQVVRRHRARALARYS